MYIVKDDKDLFLDHHTRVAQLVGRANQARADYLFALAIGNAWDYHEEAEAKGKALTAHHQALAELLAIGESKTVAQLQADWAKGVNGALNDRLDALQQGELERTLVYFFIGAFAVLVIVALIAQL